MQNRHTKNKSACSCVMTSLYENKENCQQPVPYFPLFFLRYSRVCVREARGRRLCHRLYNVTVLRAGADAGQSHQSRRSKPQH